MPSAHAKGAGSGSGLFEIPCKVEQNQPERFTECWQVQPKESTRRAGTFFLEADPFKI